MFLAKIKKRWLNIEHVKGKYVFGEYTGATSGGGGGSTEYQKQMSNWWMESAPNIWL